MTKVNFAYIRHQRGAKIHGLVCNLDEAVLYSIVWYAQDQLTKPRRWPDVEGEVAEQCVLQEENTKSRTQELLSRMYVGRCDGLYQTLAASEMNGWMVAKSRLGHHVRKSELPCPQK